MPSPPKHKPPRKKNFLENCCKYPTLVVVWSGGDRGKTAHVMCWHCGHMHMHGLGVGTDARQWYFDSVKPLLPDYIVKDLEDYFNSKGHPKAPKRPWGKRKRIYVGMPEVIDEEEEEVPKKRSGKKRKAIPAHTTAASDVVVADPFKPQPKPKPKPRVKFDWSKGHAVPIKSE